MERNDQIRQMEEILDRHTEILNEVAKALDALEENQEAYERLKEYYGSQDFMEDFEKSNKGELPKDLKCGVLSEDAIFDLIGDNYQTAIRMLELGTKMVKDH